MFQLQQNNTTIRREVVAGFTTFITMAYIIVVNPKILEAAGMPFEAAMAATILTAALGSLMMGLYSNRPFAIAPYMGENAFVAFTVVKAMGFTWQAALGATFISGVAFTLLTLLHVRRWLVEAIPRPLKVAFTVGIGFFLTFIGLNETGLVRMGVPGAPVQVGHLTDPSVLLAIVGLVGMAALTLRRVPGAILLGILGTTALAMVLHLTPTPTAWMSAPPSVLPVMGQLDIPGALRWSFFPIILTMFILVFVDTMGTLIGLSHKAGMLDAQGNLPDVERPMLCDALATTAGAFLGTTTAGAYIESAAGIEAGGRTGLTAIVTGLLFLAALFFAPVLTAIPACAYGPALILVGLLMLTAMGDLPTQDLSEGLPVFLMIALMSFTFNLGIGMTGGFVLYPLLKLLAGRGREIPAGLWVLAAISLLFFLFYPYGGERPFK